VKVAWKSASFGLSWSSFRCYYAATRDPKSVVPPAQKEPAMKNALRRHALLACCAAIATLPLNGCGGAGTSQPVAFTALAGDAGAVQRAGANPNECGKTVTYKLNPAGGKFNIPSCPGALSSGTFTYGTVEASGQATITLSVWAKNPDPSLCRSVSGQKTVVWMIAYFYRQLRVAKTAKKSTLKNPNFQKYSAFSLYESSYGGTVFLEGLGGPKKGVLLFPSPFNAGFGDLIGQWCYEVEAQ